jgi:NAD(P)-dependent dehydrogenase (short-subunit alcohol dehydrogenase family)
LRQLRDKVAVVTGAASGIGLGLSELLIEQGMHVVLADVDEPRLQREVGRLRDAGASVLGATTDVSDPGSVSSLGESVLSAFGAVHVVCSNAGVVDRLATWERSRSQWDDVLSINLGGTINTINTFIPMMLDAKHEGHYLTVASSAALLHRQGVASYNASKSAVFAIAETMAQELADIDAPIGVSVVLPGAVATRLGGAGSELAIASRTLSAGVRTTTDVAAQILDAIHTRRFYVFTHPETLSDYEHKLLGLLDAVRGDRPAPVIIDPPGIATWRASEASTAPSERAIRASHSRDVTTDGE